MTSVKAIKNVLFSLLLISIFSHSKLGAQNDTMYVMKNGITIGKYDINTEIDSVIFHHTIVPQNNFFTDERDGNEYHTVTIGSQVWMLENLRYLPFVVGNNWTSSSIPLYYVFDYFGTNVTDAKTTVNYNTYGVLYNWPAAMTDYSSSSISPSGFQGVCPSGWHLPSDSEWTQLSFSLGNDSIAGGKLKETGTVHWLSPNTGATNESGFTALPGGAFMSISYDFEGIGAQGFWWSSTEANSSGAWCRNLVYTTTILRRYDYSVSKNCAMSVRCVRD